MKSLIGVKKRQAVWKKTDGHCTYCGIVLEPSHAITGHQFCIDHVISPLLGGNHDLANLVPACHRCNSAKHQLSIEDYRKLLVRKKYPQFTATHIAHLQSLGLVLPHDFPCYPPYVFWFEEQGITL